MTNIHCTIIAICMVVNTIIAIKNKDEIIKIMNLSSGIMCAISLCVYFIGKIE